ncbi:hypothetical protein Hanom_Chr11g01059401 [Helianthus anomalus]
MSTLLNARIIVQGFCTICVNARNVVNHIYHLIWGNVYFTITLCVVYNTLIR